MITTGEVQIDFKYYLKGKKNQFILFSSIIINDKFKVILVIDQKYASNIKSSTYIC